MKRLNSKGFEMSFTWIFAIVVGISIFIFTFILVSKIMNTGNIASDAKVAKEISILFNPLETGFEEGKTSSFTLASNSRIINNCNTNGNFGRQIISTSQFTLGKWSTANVEVGSLNKYIFSNDVTEGKKFYIFAKPFKFPFKVTDLIYITSASDKYCFINSPENIENELSNLNQANIFVENCSNDNDKILVCFSGSGCDINVRYSNEAGSVLKNGETVYFETDALMYAAIFSNSELYECQVKRLMKRLDLLSQIYIDKVGFSSDSCDSNLNPTLIQLQAYASSAESSGELEQIKTLSKNIDELNDYARCSLW